MDGELKKKKNMNQITIALVTIAIIIIFVFALRIGVTAAGILLLGFFGAYIVFRMTNQNNQPPRGQDDRHRRIDRSDERDDDRQNPFG